MGTMRRRDFLRRVGAGTAAVGLAAGLRPAMAGVNDTLRVAVIGVRGQGRRHIEGLEALDGVEVVALCDVDDEPLGQQAEALEKSTGRKIARFKDLRKLYEDQSIDAVSVATPNHWHTLAGIWAMQAGKDVYIEKPISHNIWEGRQLVHAARKLGRMCQHGVQGRSAPAIREGIQKLKEGVIGEVYMARGICYRWRDTIGHTPDETPPPGVDYDLWLGPAPQRPFSRNRFYYNWHWHWDYGNGDIGNQGVHEMDLARWGLGVGMPTEVQSSGGQFLFKDDKETPNVQVSSFLYPEANKMMTFEVRPWISNWEGQFGGPKETSVGVIFFGSEGYMTLKYFWYKTFLGKNHEPGPSAQSDRNEWATFVAGVRSRKESDLGTTVEDGHISSAHCHLANAAYRLKRVLKFDAATEQVVGDDEANRILRGSHRAPYVVPEIKI